MDIKYFYKLTVTSTSAWACDYNIALIRTEACQAYGGVSGKGYKSCESVSEAHPIAIEFHFQTISDAEKFQKFLLAYYANSIGEINISEIKPKPWEQPGWVKPNEDPGGLFIQMEVDELVETYKIPYSEAWSEIVKRYPNAVTCISYTKALHKQGPNQMPAKYTPLPSKPLPAKAEWWEVFVIKSDEGYYTKQFGFITSPLKAMHFNSLFTAKKQLEALSPNQKQYASVFKLSIPIKLESIETNGAIPAKTNINTIEDDLDILI